MYLVSPSPYSNEHEAQSCKLMSSASPRSRSLMDILSSSCSLYNHIAIFSGTFKKKYSVSTMDPGPALGLASGTLSLLKRFNASLQSSTKLCQSVAPIRDILDDIELYAAILSESAATIQSVSSTPPPSAFVCLKRCAALQESFFGKLDSLAKSADKAQKATTWARALEEGSLGKISGSALQSLKQFKGMVLLLRDIASEYATTHNFGRSSTDSEAYTFGSTRLDSRSPLRMLLKYPSSLRNCQGEF